MAAVKIISATTSAALFWTLSCLICFKDLGQKNASLTAPECWLRHDNPTLENPGMQRRMKKLFWQCWAETLDHLQTRFLCTTNYMLPGHVWMESWIRWWMLQVYWILQRGSVRFFRRVWTMIWNRVSVLIRCSNNFSMGCRCLTTRFWGQRWRIFNFSSAVW